MIEPRTLDELIDWLVKLRKSQEGTLLTNVRDIQIREAYGRRAPKLLMRIEHPSGDE